MVVGATDFATATTVAANNEVFCLSCHKAHGSDQPFSTVWNYGSANPAGCQQCHNR
jgi:predicted CXXCH cytochrome family protein